MSRKRPPFFVRLLDRVLSVADALAYWYFVSVPALVIWLGILGLFVDYSQLPDGRVLDFIWQLVVFSFTAAAVVPILPGETYKSKKPVLVALFVLGGMGTLFSYGTATAGTMNGAHWITMIGGAISALSMFSLSLGISVLAAESFRATWKRA